MIWFDRLFRYFNKDMYLPIRCNAQQYNMIFNGSCNCDCKNFCKFPKKTTLVTSKILLK